MTMNDLITRADAIQAVRHAWAKGLEPSQYIEIVPAVDAIPVEWIQAQRIEHPQTVVEFARNVAYRTVLYG